MEYIILFGIFGAVALVDGTRSLSRSCKGKPRDLKFDFRNSDHWSIAVVMVWPVLIYTFCYLVWLAVFSESVIIPVMTGRDALMLPGAIINGVTIPLAILCWVIGGCLTSHDNGKD
jgi:hypothetical protein